MNQHFKSPNAVAGWTRDLAKSSAHGLGGQGYHWLLAIPHNEPDEKFAKSKGKAPGIVKRTGTWFLRKDWTETSVKPNAVEAFANIPRATRYVPNIGILCGESVEIDGKHIGYLTAIDIDTADENAKAMFSELFDFDNPMRRGKRG